MGTLIVFYRSSVNLMALTLSETSILIEGIAKRLKEYPRTGKAYFLTLTRKYCERFKSPNHPSVIEEVRRLLASSNFANSIRLTENEFSSLGSLFPVTAAEAKILVKTLDRIPGDELQKLLE